jgi:hypothetical protein
MAGMGKTALLIIDAQQEYFAPIGKLVLPDGPRAVEPFGGEGRVRGPGPSRPPVQRQPLDFAKVPPVPGHERQSLLDRGSGDQRILSLQAR